jgi:outer membrane protein W
MHKIPAISSFRAILLPLTLACTLAASSPGAEGADKDSLPLFLRQHQVGVRLGGWTNLGDNPPDSGDITVNGTDIDGHFFTNLNSTAFFIELYYGHRWNRYLMLELAGGTANRGSVTITDSADSDIGNLVLYPITVQLRTYPFTTLTQSFYPYVSAGMALHIGRRKVQFTSAGYYFSNWEDETSFDLNWVVSGGIDWPLARQIGLDLNVKYMPVNFSSSLLTKNDYSAIAVTIGVKYLYSQ